MLKDYTKALWMLDKPHCYLTMPILQIPVGRLPSRPPPVYLQNLSGHVAR